MSRGGGERQTPPFAFRGLSGPFRGRLDWSQNDLTRGAAVLDLRPSTLAGVTLLIRKRSTRGSRRAPSSLTAEGHQHGLLSCARVAQELAQRFRVHGLHRMLVESRLPGALPVRILPPPCHRDNPDRAGPGALRDPACRLVATEFGQ